MLRGIDISNWQKDLNVALVVARNDIDFVIAKATEGLSYVDPSCDKHIQAAIKSGKKFGYYHFARNNDPAKEAEYFLRNTTGYLYKGIPVLDLEDMQIRNWKTYVDTFCSKFHSMSNVWPMVYMSAGNIPFVRNCSIAKHCALWVAGYPTKSTHWDDFKYAKPPYTLTPWENWTVWQFTSGGGIKGYEGKDVDLDFANLTKDGWDKIASGYTVSQVVMPSEQVLAQERYALEGAIDTLARQVIKGRFGTGNDRKNRIYSMVQERVNELLSKGES